MNRNYTKGRAKEYKTMETLKKDGWKVARSAASHGAVDVFAARDGKVLLIQVKSGGARVTKEELDELIEWGRSSNGDAEVWHFGTRKLVKRRVYAAKRAK